MVLTVILVLISIVIFDLSAIEVSVGRFTDFTALEVWWTVVPGVTLLTVALPSLRLLYLMDEVTPH